MDVNKINLPPPYPPWSQAPPPYPPLWSQAPPPKPPYPPICWPKPPRPPPRPPPRAAGSLGLGVTSLTINLWPLMLIFPIWMTFLLIRSLSNVTKQKFFGSLFLDLSMGRTTSVMVPYSARAVLTSSSVTPSAGSFPTYILPGFTSAFFTVHFLPLMECSPSVAGSTLSCFSKMINAKPLKKEYL